MEMKNFMVRQWKGAETYFEKHLKQTFLICLSVFIVLIIINLILFSSNPQMSEMYFNELMAVFKGKTLLNSTGVDLWIGIFINNIIAGGISVLLGGVPFLFLPYFSLASNAIIIGLMGAVYQMNGIGWLPFMVGILPHGVIEIPTLILGVTLGVHICSKLVKQILKRSFKGELKQAIIGCLQIYVCWMIPLFFLASFIEVFITPILFNAVV
jgi:stage II sporulation protein M